MCLSRCFRNCLGPIFFILCFIEISNTFVSDGFPSSQNTLCKFTLSNGEVIDISELENSSKPLIAATNTSLYIYHPCKDVPLNSKQDNECQKSYGLCYFQPKNSTDKPIDFDKVISNETPGNFSLLGYNKNGAFRENNLKPEIVFFSEPVTVVTYIQLVCNESVENYLLSIDKKISEQKHVLTLSSRRLCLETVHYMSGGTVFFIILIVFVALYFIGGVLVLKFIRGATGIEMIPNHEFWCSLPQLAKDGFKYLTSCGKSTPDSYEKI